MDISLNNIWFLGVRLVANTSNLNISKDIWKIVLLLSYYKNLGYWWPFAVGFMSLCLLVSKLEHFKKSCQKNIFIAWDLLPFSVKHQQVKPSFTTTSRVKTSMKISQVDEITLSLFQFHRNILISNFLFNYPQIAIPFNFTSNYNNENNNNGNRNLCKLINITKSVNAT